jgi:trehalose/maltose transport system substrate-binding protein
MLVRFLTSRNEQAKRCREYSWPPTIPELYKDPEILARNPYFSTVLTGFRQGIAMRPSAVAGKTYPELSRDYFEAVHAVLMHNRPASQAASELQQQLGQIQEKSGDRRNASPSKEPSAAQH